MAKAPGSAKAPEPRKGKKSVTQAEIKSALEMLKRGEGTAVGGFLVLELENMPKLSAARSAVYNLRWALNPKNTESKRADAAEFERLFGGGRGEVTVYEGEGESILIAVPESYADEAPKPAKK